MLAEAVMIIPDTRQRLEAALQELTNFVVRLLHRDVVIMLISEHHCV